MKGITPIAQEKMQKAIDEIGLRPSEIVSAILETLRQSEIEDFCRAKYPSANEHKRAKLYKRRLTSSSPYRSKYGFGQMALGERHKLEYGSDVSPDMPLQAARLFARRWGLDYRYEKVGTQRAYYLWFYKKGEMPKEPKR